MQRLDTIMTYNLLYFRELEEKILAEEIATHFPLGTLSTSAETDIVINNTFKSVHSRMICNLISLYMSKYCQYYSNNFFSDFFVGEYVQVDDILLDNIDFKTIPQICEELHIIYLNSIYTYRNGKIARKKSKTNLLEAGAVYTQDKIAYDIVHRTLSNAKVAVPSHIKVLDFATGTGRFYKQIVVCLNKIFNINKEDAILKNIYAVDVDPVAINICRLSALSQIENLNIDKAAIVANHIILRNALMKEDLFDDNMAISQKDLDGLFFNGFH